MTKSTWIWVIAIIFLIGIVGGIIYFNGSANKPLSITSGDETIRILVPHLASIECKQIDTGTPTYLIPESGTWISKYVSPLSGSLTKNVEDITLSVDYGFWESLWRDVRFVYQICDKNGNNCGEEKIIKYLSAGTRTQVTSPQSIDLSINSIHVKFQASSIPFVWKDLGNKATISFKYDKWGLYLYSTTSGNKIVCTSSCDLSCPTQAVRSALVYESRNSLTFGETTSYLEYWAEPALVGEQYGGTVWDSAKKEFCFGGYIYKSGILIMDDGTQYTYPETYDRQVECCNGASISLTSGGEKVCQSNKWVTINPEDPETIPECISDISCPNQGQATCTEKFGGFYKSGYSCVENKCIKKAESRVECCPVSKGCATDQVCQNFKCVGGGAEVPEDLTGNGTVNANKKCSSCDAFAFSKMVAEIFGVESKQCKQTLFALPPQTYTTCFLSFLQLGLVPIVLIFASLFGYNVFNKFKGIKKNEFVKWMLSIIVAVICAYLVFVLFWIGLILFILLIILRIMFR